MKKIVNLIIALVLPLGIYAQENAVNNDDSSKIDSLTQVANDLSAQLQEAKKAELNDAIWKNRSKYFYISYMDQTLTEQEAEGMEWKSDFGVSLGYGKTFYLHKKPLFNIIKFGLDFGIDLSYAKYSEPDEIAELSEDDGEETLSYPTEPQYEEEELDLGAHQIEGGLHIGPSITINPVHHLKVSGYFHFIPSYSGIIINDEFNSSYVTNFAFGGAIAYKAISVGVESRWGKAKYDSYYVNEENLELDNMEEGGDIEMDDMVSEAKSRLKTKSLRVYIAFRF